MCVIVISIFFNELSAEVRMMSCVIKTFLHSLKSHFETRKVVASSLENHISSLKEQNMQSKLFNFDSIDLEDKIRAQVYLF